MARGLLGADGAAVSLVRDSTGMVSQRVVAHIINIAAEIAQQGIAEPADIDRAVTLGLGYPRGPLAWGDELGAKTVLEHPQQPAAGNRRPALPSQPVAAAARRAWPVVLHREN